MLTNDDRVAAAAYVLFRQSIRHLQMLSEATQVQLWQDGRDGYCRQARDVLAAADEADPVVGELRAERTRTETLRAENAELKAANERWLETFDWITAIDVSTKS